MNARTIKLPALNRRVAADGHSTLELGARMTLAEALDVIVDAAAHTGQEGVRFEARGVIVLVARGAFAPVIDTAFDRAAADRELARAALENHDSERAK